MFSMAQPSPKMHFAQIGVHRAEIAREIGVDLDRVGADVEQPRLRIVRVGGERCGGDQRQRRVSSPGSFQRRHGA